MESEDEIMKIYKKIFLVFITTSLITITLISITSYLIARASLASQVMKQLESVASIQNEKLEILFDHNLENLALISSRTQLRLSLKDYIRDPQTRYQDKMNRILRDARSSIKHFKEISVLTLDGKIVASTDLSRIGTINIDEEYFIRGQKGNVGDIFYLDKNKDLIMHLAEPLILQNKILGVIEVTATAQAITSMVTDYSGLGETGYAIIVKKVNNGKNFIRSPDRIKGKISHYTLVDYNDLDPVSRKVFLKDASIGGNLIDSCGESVIAATQYCEKFDMGFGVRINTTEAFSPVTRLCNIMILIILFSILLTVIVSFLISKSITKPIAGLSDVAGKICGGDLELKADGASKDEVGMLGRSFNNMVGTLKKDIAERKQGQEKLKIALQKREELELIINKSPAIVFLWRAAEGWPVEFVSENIDQLGYTPEDFIGGHISYADIIHKDDLKRVGDEVAMYSEQDALEFTQEYRIVTKSGDIRWTDDITWIRYDQNGNITHYQGVVFDVTDRVRAEAEVKESKSKLESIFRAAPTGIGLVSNRVLLEVNDRICQMTGYSSNELIGKDAKMLYPTDEDYEYVGREKYVRIRERGTGTVETRWKRKDGGIIDVLLSSTPNDPDDHLAGVTFTALDITERKQIDEELKKYRDHLEERVQDRTKDVEDAQKALLNLLEDVNTAKNELAQANEKLLELDRLKSMFIASMSHELRTPLNSIIGFTGVMLQGMSGEINDEQKDQLQRVYASGKHLLALITDVIDISKIEAEKTETFVSEFNLAEVIAEAAVTVQPEIEKKGLALEVIRSGALSLKTDRRRLLQCILNLLSNAVKYTEKGTIRVETHVHDALLDISVIDTGIGISEQDLPILFQSFVRLESHLKIIAGGTGLGLYLTKKIASDLLGGTISVESTFGEGSTFVLTIPQRIDGKE